MVIGRLYLHATISPAASDIGPRRTVVLPQAIGVKTVFAAFILGAQSVDGLAFIWYGGHELPESPVLHVTELGGCWAIGSSYITLVTAETETRYSRTANDSEIIV